MSIVCSIGAALAACEGRSAEHVARAERIRAGWPGSHPLIGRVYRTRSPVPTISNLTCEGRDLSTLMDDLALKLEAGALVVLGEIHDNNWHHKLRAEFLDGAKAVVFEHIRADQQDALDTFAAAKAVSQRAPKADDLLGPLEWEKSPWSKTADFRPLFDAVVSVGLPVYAGDPPRATIRKLAKEGMTALDRGEIDRLALSAPLGADLDRELVDEIEGSHCGMIPKASFAPMAAAQRYRDAHLADALLRAGAAHGGAVLFAGNGHARTDRGVPWYIRQRAPDQEVVSVALIEVEDGKTETDDYLPRDPEGEPAVDYIVFTPRVERGDPCEGMAK